MKKSVLFIILLFAVGMTAQAQKFALIDMEYILKNIPAYERANEQLSQATKQWQGEVEVLAKEAQTMFKDYQAASAKLTAAQKTQKEDAIVEKEKAASELKRKYFGPEGELFKKREELMKPIQDEIYNAVKAVAEENGYAVVVDRASASSIIFATPRIDVIIQINNKTMLKKIALLMMLILPMGVFAQNLKFGHINAMEIVSAMPEYTKAQSELQALNKQLGQDLQRSQEEFSKKYQEFMQQKDSLPAVIAERRQKELEDMMQRQEQFQAKAQQDMEKANNDLMAPVYKKLDDAIKAVGAAEGVIYIFDMARTPIPYVNEAQSINLTPKVKTQLGIK